MRCFEKIDELGMCGTLRSLAALPVLATVGCVGLPQNTLPDQPLAEIDMRATLPEVDVALRPVGDAQMVDTAGPAADGDVEEVVVVGSRIRRWLPIVGAAWPTSECRLSVREVGDGALRWSSSPIWAEVDVRGVMSLRICAVPEVAGTCW